jgi:hypothetical protein
MTSRSQRPSQVRPRAPSTGRPVPSKRPTQRQPTPGRIAPHRKIDRGPGLPLWAQLLLVVAIVALGAAILFSGMGLLGKVVAGIGSAFSGAITQVTATASPSPTPAVAPNAPTLTPPTESYTNQPKIDLTGLIPSSYIGRSGATIRVYRALASASPTQIAEIPVGVTPGFIVPDITLGNGRNDFTATIVDPGGESAPSKVVTYVLDTTKPKITITAPTKDALVNDKTVTIAGKTQARSAMVAKNQANSASITATAGDDGSFSMILAISTGTNAIQITATDPAGNQTVTAISVIRGSGKLSAKLTASRYQFAQGSLPMNITLSVAVTDPNGRPLDGAAVTLTLTPPGVGPITQTLTTDATGTAIWQTAIPAGASPGKGIAAALVETTAFGTTTAQTVITIGP